MRSVGLWLSGALKQRLGCHALISRLPERRSCASGHTWGSEAALVGRASLLADNFDQRLVSDKIWSTLGQEIAALLAAPRGGAAEAAGGSAALAVRAALRSRSMAPPRPLTRAAGTLRLFPGARCVVPRVGAALAGAPKGCSWATASADKRQRSTQSFGVCRSRERCCRRRCLVFQHAPKARDPLAVQLPY